MKNFINISDLSSKELRSIIEEAKLRKLNRKKLNKSSPDRDRPFEGKSMAMIFEKPSTRTRMSFDIAIKQLGGHSIILNPDGIHYGKGDETLKDTAKVLTEYVDIVMLRTSSHKNLDEVGKYREIPIINGLSPSAHPTQVLSDIFTIEEIKKKPISKLNICWIGDGNNNVINSLIAASVKFSFSLNIGCPKKYKPNKRILRWVKMNKKRVNIFVNPKDAAKNADVIFTDKVISMNDKVNKIEKLKDFKNYQVNSRIMGLAKKNAIFLHCLPRGQEVTDSVFLGNQSKVWQQAFNRVYVQKSILLYCFNKLR